MINEFLRIAVYYVDAFLRRPLWAIGPALLTVAVGMAVILVLPRTYQSEALLLIEAPQSSPTSLLPATVASEQLQFIEQRVLARDKLLALAERLDLFAEQRSAMSQSKLAQLMRQHILIHSVASEPSERYSGTTSMRVAFQAPTPEQASAAVSALVDMIIEENRGQRLQRITEMTTFLDREVADMSQTMSSREADWQRFFEENANAMPARAQSLDSELQERDRELTGLDQSIATLDQELRLLEAELRLGRQRPETAVRDREQLAELESELATRAVTYSPAHPESRALSQRIEGLRQKIASYSQSAGDDAVLSPDLALVAERVDIARARHASLVERRAEMTERIGWLRTVLASAPAVQAQLEAIERERETLQRNLDEMRGRLSTARVGERLEQDNATGHVQILERPETPRYPASPNRTQLMLLLAAAAAAVGAGGVYLGDSLRSTVRGTFDLATPLAGSTIVVVPQWSPAEARRSVRQAIVDRIAALFGIDRPAMT